MLFVVISVAARERLSGGGSTEATTRNLELSRADRPSLPSSLSFLGEAEGRGIGRDHDERPGASARRSVFFVVIFVVPRKSRWRGNRRRLRRRTSISRPPIDVPCRHLCRSSGEPRAGESTKMTTKNTDSPFAGRGCVSQASWLFARSEGLRLDKDHDKEHRVSVRKPIDGLSSECYIGGAMTDSPAASRSRRGHEVPSAF